MNDVYSPPINDFPDITGDAFSLTPSPNHPFTPSPSPSTIDFTKLRSVFACALHMHQPLIPAGGNDLHTAAIIGNLQHMFEHPEIQDSHNAGVFRWCYQRMGEFIPQLVAEGKHPRIMLDYSGCLLHGLQRMGATDVIDALKPLAQHPDYIPCVEWLGTAWGHAVAPSTPPQDFRLHVQAWRNHFASIFGAEALARVTGFSPPEMALPNHPDVAYEFINTLKESGYRWLLVQEHTIEQTDTGQPIAQPHLPHRLIARNSVGQSTSIIAIIKTQGSDTKLVAQMQPYYEARNLQRQELAGQSIPPIVTQIADGENGGVMMNEFPPMYERVMREAGDASADTRPANVGEYFAYLDSLGIAESDLPTVQPIFQQRIWNRFETAAGPQSLPQSPEVKLEAAIADLRKEDPRFHVEGGSWTSNLSWTRGYENVLGPMEQVSRLFDQKIRSPGVNPSDPRYQSALYHLMLTQTSCFRYWGQGAWADYGKEFCRRAIKLMSAT